MFSFVLFPLLLIRCACQQIQAIIIPSKQEILSSVYSFITLLGAVPQEIMIFLAFKDAGSCFLCVILSLLSGVETLFFLVEEAERLQSPYKARGLAPLPGLSAAFTF